MTSYEELDILHKDAAYIAVQIATEMVWAVNGRAPKKEVRRLADRLDRVIVAFTNHLHALLLSEGLRIVYQPGATQYGDKEVMRVWLGTRYQTQHLIVIAVHPRHHTLIYYNDPPFLGTISELVHSLHNAHEKELARERCSGCHYINTELWVCGMGRVLDVECRDYIGREYL